MILMMIITLIPLNVFAEDKLVKSMDSGAKWLIENDEIDSWAIMDLARMDKEIPETSLIEFREEIKASKGGI